MENVADVKMEKIMIREEKAVSAFVEYIKNGMELLAFVNQDTT